MAEVGVVQPAPQATSWHSLMETPPNSLHVTVPVPPRTRTNLALVLSILAVPAAPFLLGLGLCIPALIIARRTLALRDQFPNHPDVGKAKVARVLAWIAIAVNVWLIFGFLMAWGWYMSMAG